MKARLIFLVAILYFIPVTNTTAHCIGANPRHCATHVNSPNIPEVLDSLEEEITDLVEASLPQGWENLVPGGQILRLFTTGQCGSGVTANIVPDGFGTESPGPFADFRPACAEHDTCYEQQLGKEHCDSQFLVDLNRQCNDGFSGGYLPLKPACYVVAETYAITVRQMGGDAYRNSVPSTHEFFPIPIITGDFNGDGLSDIGAFNPNGNGLFFINYGDGLGNFGNIIRETSWNWAGLNPRAGRE